jgi:hypothetical protein
MMLLEKCEYLMMLASTRDVDLSVASPPWPSSEEVVGVWQVGNGNTEYGVLLRVQYRVVDGVVSCPMQFKTLCTNLKMLVAPQRLFTDGP